MLNVQVVSRETIKPSSSTSENLRYLKLSRLDQRAPTVHVPLVLYYSGNVTAEISRQLKKSLSEVLTRFYPLAGRIREQDESGYSHVECNDEGVEFYEARVDGVLSEFLRHPTMEESRKLLPSVVPLDVPLLIQFSVFRSGGSAIGVFLSHKVGDGASMAMFINWWADATRGGGDVQKEVSPSFGFASLFPPKVMKRRNQELPTSIEKLVSKRMIFEASKIAQLRGCLAAKATTGGLFPTRVEAVTALIWRCNMRARGEGEQERKPMALHPVNIRGRIEPPLPEYSFGNLYILALATGKQVRDDCGRDVGYLEGLLRSAIGKIKGDYIRQVLENDMEMNSNLSGQEGGKYGIDFIVFSSWCRFPFYESNFGWGRPAWLSLTNAGYLVKNAAVLLPTSNDEGIEVWVQMVEDEMAKFEQDPELLAFASITN